MLKSCFSFVQTRVVVVFYLEILGAERTPLYKKDLKKSVRYCPVFPTLPRGGQPDVLCECPLTQKFGIKMMKKVDLEFGFIQMPTPIGITIFFCLQATRLLSPQPEILAKMKQLLTSTFSLFFAKSVSNSRLR